MNTPTGHCFEDSFSAIARGQAEGLPDLSKFDSVSLVHGTTNVGPHAWIRLTSGKFCFVYETQEKRIISESDHRDAIRASAERTYTIAEAVKLAFTTGHTGPWQ